MDKVISKGRGGKSIGYARTAEVLVEGRTQHLQQGPDGKWRNEVGRLYVLEGPKQ